jgi:zinc finger SWIM domain-containing protein 3
VTKDFEYALEKSEPSRVTAKCTKQECIWRIHASVSQDDVTFIVKTMQPTHTCIGVNKRGNKHANEGWVADRVINYLRSEGISQQRF